MGGESEGGSGGKSEREVRKGIGGEVGGLLREGGGKQGRGAREKTIKGEVETTGETKAWVSTSVSSE